jgi:hypothetical protein
MGLSQTTTQFTPLSFPLLQLVLDVPGMLLPQGLSTFSSLYLECPSLGYLHGSLPCLLQPLATLLLSATPTPPDQCLPPLL